MEEKMMEQKVIEQLKQMGYEVTEEDVRVTFFVAKIKEDTLNYCNLRKIPKAIFHTMAEMCIVTFVQSENAKKAKEVVDNGVGGVTSVKTGDTQTNFDNGSINFSVLNQYVFETMKTYKKKLNAFRKIR